MNIEISVTSDFICPWCLIGERRLTKALETVPDGVEVKINWLPYELNPDMPADGLDRRTYRSMKFGSWARSQMLDAQTIIGAKGDDVTFRYDLMNRTPNTQLAHRLMVLASMKGKGKQMADALFSAYFEQGKDIGDAKVLSAIAAELGLTPDETEDYLTGMEGKAEVQEAEATAAAAGVRSVPLFDIGGEMISGAQSVAQMAGALERALERQIGCSGGACSVG